MKFFSIFLIILIVSACSTDKIEPPIQYLSEWVKIREESEFDSFFDIDFADNNFGLISGTSGRLFKTVDGGVTWKKIELGTDMSLFRTSALNENIFVGGGSSLFVTKDGGESFSEITLIQDTKAIWDIHFIDQQIWYGRGAHVYKTTDGGTNWNDIYNPEPYGLQGTFISSPETLYAYGGESLEHFMDSEIISSGFLTKSTDGGANWVELNDSTITSSELTWVFFINNLGFMNNISGKTYRTNNGGISWTLMDLPDLNTNRMYFISEQTGYCSGKKKLYKTTDGGLNWEIDLEADTLRRSFSKIVNTENYLYLLNEGGAVFKKSIE